MTRARNTLAARKSRLRKRKQVQKSNETVDKIEGEISHWEDVGSRKIQLDLGQAQQMALPEINYQLWAIIRILIKTRRLFYIYDDYSRLSRSGQI